MKSIGIDIGGSHISCGLFNHNSNKLEHKLYFPSKINYSLDIQLSTKNFIQTIINLIDEFITKNKINISDISSIGLGCPGGIDKEKGIFYGSSLLHVKEINFKKELNKYTIPIFIENDCTCAGICESYINNINNFIMLTIGSNLGISYMHNYTCINEIVWDIFKTNQKSKNTDKTYLQSLHNLSQKYNEIKKQNLPRTEIFNSLKFEDYYAKIIMQNYINDFIIGIKKITAKYNIKTISIGGGISEYSEYFIPKIQTELSNLNILVAKFKNDSGIIGSALLQNIS